jgi:hypothetical protein
LGRKCKGKIGLQVQHDYWRSIRNEDFRIDGSTEFRTEEGPYNILLDLWQHSPADHTLKLKTGIL